MLLAVILTATLTPPAYARSSVNVLVGTEVSEAAQSTMSPALWAKLVGQWVGEHVVPFKGRPTLADCANAKAVYMVYAPFELRPKLPGGTMLHVNDRIAALTHVTVTNCATRQSVFDQIIAVQSNPITTSNEGDLEPAASVTWESSIRDVLRAHPLVFTTVARISHVSPPFVIIDGVAKGLAVGQTLRVYARADGSLLSPPVILTVTEVFGRQVRAQYDSTNPQNKIESGDLVEPYAATAPSK